MPSSHLPARTLFCRMCLHVLTDCDCVFSPSTPCVCTHPASHLLPLSSRSGNTAVRVARGCFPTSSPTESPSLDAPLSESLSPSPTQPPAPRTQNTEEKPEEEEEQEDEGDRSVSVPCYEIHATGLRRCSEPLTFNLPPPGAEPPAQTLSHRIVSSEQRFLSLRFSFPVNPALTTCLSFSPNVDLT